MFGSMIIVLLILFLPRVMTVAAARAKFLSTLGPVFLCYAAGFLLSFLFEDTSIAAALSEVCVPIAIPLILFSAELKSLKKLAKPVLTSFALMCVTVLLVSAVGFFIFRSKVDNAFAVSGMAVGLYTGGTPNLLAIGMALGLDQTTILLANTADFVVGGVYFFLLISVMPKLVRGFLPKYKASGNSGGSLETTLEERFSGRKDKFSWKGSVLPKLPLFGLAVLCVLVSLGASYIFTGKLTDIVVVMLGVTTLGIALSFVKKVREAPGSYLSGQYLILMFSVAMGLQFDLSKVTRSAMMLFLMLAFIQFVSVALHMLLAKLFRIDADTALVTSTAGIYGPAFIPAVAGALKNSEIVLAGLLTGILGYAVGNYLGIGVASLLALF